MTHPADAAPPPARRPNVIVEALRQIARELDVTWRFPAVIGGALFLTAMIMLALWVSDRRYAASGAGDLRGAQLAQLADGRPIIVVGAVLDYNNLSDGGNQIYQPRLHSIDPVTGAELARVEVDEPRQCQMARPGLLWCDSNLTSGSLFETRDAATLLVQTTHAQVVAAAPPLASQSSATVDARTGEAWMPTLDGRFWHVDPRTLQGGLEDQNLGSDRALPIGPSRSPLMGSIHVAMGTLYFDGSPRSVLMVSDGREGKNAIAPENTYIYPQFIVDQEGIMRAETRPLTLDDGKVVLVAHDDTVDHGTARLLLSAVTLAGERRWTATLEHGEIRAAWIIEGLLVLAIARDPQGEVVGLDGRDGRVVWQRGT